MTQVPWVPFLLVSSEPSNVHLARRSMHVIPFLTLLGRRYGVFFYKRAVPEPSFVFFVGSLHDLLASQQVKASSSLASGVLPPRAAGGIGPAPRQELASTVCEIHSWLR